MRPTEPRLAFWRASGWMLSRVQPHRRRFLSISLLTLASSALSVLQPWPVKLVADHVLGSNPLPKPLAAAFALVGLPATPVGILVLAVAGGLLLYLLHAIGELFLTFSWTLVGRRLVNELAEELFRRLQRTSLLFHARHPVGDVMSRITHDSWCVWQFVDAVLFAPGHALLTIVLMVALMLRLDAGLTVLAVAVAPFMVGASFLISKPLRRAAQLKREIEGRIASHLQQTLAGIPVVQAFVQEERAQERFRRFADDAVRAQQRSAVLGSFNSLGTGLIATLGAGAILWVGAHHVLNGTLTVGSLLIFFAYLTALQAQLRTFAGVNTTWRQVSASVDRVLEMLELGPEVTEAPNAVLLSRPRGQVSFEEVTFGYEAGRPVLREISFVAEPGETIAIVGPTGVGKSTLAGLIPRLFDPWRGAVRIDGYDLRLLQLASLRQQVSLVLQEPFLFPLSVAENIAYGRPGASLKEIEAAARAAHAHEFIENLPEGYGTVIGERGATLSGGERQRLAIARALLKPASILIFDEPTSALDAATESLLLQNWKRRESGQTTFLIAHRLSTVRRADRILVLQEGRITESGTHEELMVRAGFYAHLHRIQFQREPLESNLATPS